MNLPVNSLGSSSGNLRLSQRPLILALLIGGLLSAPPATAICVYVLAEQTIEDVCRSYDQGQTFRCTRYITNYWDEYCSGGSGGGGGGNPPPGGGWGNGGPSCPIYLSVVISAIDASVAGRTAYLRSSIASDGSVYSSAAGPGADTSGVSGVGTLSFPVNLDAVPIGSSTYSVTASASGPAGCPPLSGSATGMISRSSATAVASSDSGLVAIPTGGTFLIGTVTIGGYDAFDRLTATPAGENLPTLWTDRSVARVSVSPRLQLQTQFSNVAMNHNIGAISEAPMQPMQGSFLPTDDAWNKTFMAQQQFWMPAPVPTNSRLEWIRFDGNGLAQVPIPPPVATATLQ